MPTNKNECKYREYLDVVHDIISRYELTRKIILCSDLNGTLLPTRNNKHDVILKNFIKELFLSIGSYCLSGPTFYHFNGVVTHK